MSDCPNCGHSVNPRAKFCEACGSALAASEQMQPTREAPAIEIGIGLNGMNVMLLPTDESASEAVIGLLVEACGYEADDARLITSAAPVTFARYLTECQAMSLAHVFTASGASVAVYDSNGYREHAPSSSCEDDHCEPLNAVNRISRNLMRPWNYPYSFAGDMPPAFK